jgi:DNA modification methylase
LTPDLHIKDATVKIDLKKNTIVCGDNEEWMKDIPDNSVDICYIDPPFFSNRNFEIIWGNGYEKRAFEDRFSGRISNYIEWMRPKIELIHKKLKKTGVIFLHCDWHASHRLRCVLDDVFGEQNFVNEIIWKRIHTVKGNYGQGKKGLDPNTDTIFFYSKSNNYDFTQPFGSYSAEYIEKFYKYEEPDGRKYRLISMIGPGGAAKGNPKYEVMGVTKYWRYSQAKMKDLIKNNMVVQTKKGNVPQRKQYLDEGRGVAVQTLWEDLFFEKGESLNYPTQKPKSLLHRIIDMSGKNGNLILDCFGGGGTTAAVALERGMKFITGDVSPVACKIIAERLLFDYGSKAEFELKNLPQTEHQLKMMDGHKFAESVCEVMGWKVNPKKTSDGGIDGWADKIPVQVKNHSSASAGRPDMQKFFGAIAAKKSKQGIFVAWSFSKDAIEYIAEVKREHKVDIVPKKCSDVFGGLLLDNSKGDEIEEL